MRLGLTIAALALAFPAQAQQISDAEARRLIHMVDDLAFDPVRFFDDGYLTEIRIRYRGDDRGWPVYSIAVRTGCGDADEPRPACYENRVARMLRAPIGPLGAQSPRNRGIDLMARIFKSGARREAAVKAQLDTAGLEWVEADLRTCPGAMEMLARAEAVHWGPYTPPPNPSGEITITIHADTIEARLRRPDGWVTWLGNLANPDGPGRWADDFAKVLEPCWRPASAPTPWRRVPAPN